MATYTVSRLACALGLFTAASLGSAHAVETPGYGFPAAAQEITQLYWLAETANACGWSSTEEAQEFKLFARRFLSAYLSDQYREALATMVLAPGYEERVRAAAQEGAAENCRSNRWRLGWLAYKSAAEEHAGEY